MKRWTSGPWFQPLTVLILASFFMLYGIDLALYARIAEVQAQSIDELLEEDDSDLLDVVDSPPPEKEEAKPSETKPEEKEESLDKQDKKLDEEDEELDEEDEALDEEDEELDEEDEELDEEPVRKTRRSSKALTARPRVDGPKKIVAMVFPANSKYKRRAVEESILVDGWLRGSSDFTHMPITKALGDKGTVDEDLQAKRAQKALSSGIEGYHNVDLDLAVEDLEDSISLFGPLLEFPEYRAKAEEAMFYLAASHVLNGDGRDGKNTFTKLLQNNPAAKIEGKGFPPGVVDSFEAAKDDIDDAPTASLKVSSKPGKLAAFLDGQFRGLTPIKLDNLPVGEHYLTVREPAYQDYQSKITLYKGVSKSLSVKPRQTKRYYNYRPEIAHIEGHFNHKAMYDAVQNLGDVLKTDDLLFCRVSESSGIVSIEAFYYDLESEQYKSRSVQIELASESLDVATYDFLDLLFSSETQWQDTYIPPEEIVKEEDDSVTPWYYTWWFWTIVGVVVAGGVTTGVLLGTGVLDDDSSDTPDDGNNFEHPNAIEVRF